MLRHSAAPRDVARRGALPHATRCYFSRMAHWVSVKEAASAADVDEETVRRWCRQGLVDAQLTPGGGRWRVRLGADDLPARR